ncbi:MAG TPA: glycoside hydrolase family 127 protein [Phycisphaerales bacterium]|nr:glycoside hydrolase family 127 protein [Phycisphaerales bacterium]HMP36238.1 glycoside hydrolase family 127 protein [Phycisphaerales bacterium]
MPKKTLRRAAVAAAIAAFIVGSGATALTAHSAAHTAAIAANMISLQASPLELIQETRRGQVPPAQQPAQAPPDAGAIPLEDEIDLTIPERPIRPMRFYEYALHDPFWSEAQVVNRRRSLTHLWNEAERHGRGANFDLAARREQGPHQGPATADADLYRIAEAAAFALAGGGDDFASMRLDDLVRRIVAAQLPDGYIDTSVQLRDPAARSRWNDLSNGAELSNQAFLMLAGVALWEAQGRRELLDAGARAANGIVQTFGPNRRGAMGRRPMIELGLQRLHDVTGAGAQRELAEWFLDRRRLEHARAIVRGGTGAADGEPLLGDEELLALLIAAARHARETRDDRAKAVLRDIWAALVPARVSVIGSLEPPRTAGEAGSPPGSLDASVALAELAHEMAMLDGDARPFDVAERVLYNAARGGVSLSGDRFHSALPLSNDGSVARGAWFEDPSGPLRLLRVIASVDEFVAARDRDVVYINFYPPGEFATTFARPIVRFTIRGEYPWNEKAQIWVQASRPREFTLALRVPAWCEQPILRINHAEAAPRIENGYMYLDREWSNDIIDLEFPMPVRTVAGRPDVPGERGRFALMRGPVAYCVEQGDLGADVDLSTLRFDPSGSFEVFSRNDLFDGLPMIRGTAEIPGRAGAAGVPVEFTAIPYFAHGNRGPAPMSVWLPTAEPDGQ